MTGFSSKPLGSQKGKLGFQGSCRLENECLDVPNAFHLRF